MSVPPETVPVRGRGAWSRCWHAVLAVIVLASFVTQVILLVNGGEDANSGDAGTGVSLLTRFVRLFSYFTIQSNLLILVAAATLALDPFRDGRIWRALRLDSLLGIIITGLVYDLVLASQVHFSGAALWTTIGFHYVAPWGAVLGWLLFGPRPRITWATAGAASVWPVLWLVYTFVHGAISNWYPYSFLNADHLGLGVAVRNTAFVIILAGVIALVLRAFDRLPTIRR